MRLQEAPGKPWKWKKHCKLDVVVAHCKLLRLIKWSTWKKTVLFAFETGSLGAGVWNVPHSCMYEHLITRRWCCVEAFSRRKTASWVQLWCIQGPQAPTTSDKSWDRRCCSYFHATMDHVPPTMSALLFFLVSSTTIEKLTSTVSLELKFTLNLLCSSDQPWMYHPPTLSPLIQQL